MAIIIERTVNLDALGVPEQARGTLYQQENLAHRFVIHGRRGGADVNFSGNVSAYFVKPDGETVDITNGTLDGGAAVVELPQICYAVSGRFTLTIFVTENGAKTAVYSMTGNVRVTKTDGEVVPPGTPVPDYSEIVDQYQDMVQATAEAENAVRVLYGEYGGDWGPSGSGVGITYTKTGPMVKAAGSRTSTGHRFVGFSLAAIASITTTEWTASKESVTNENLVMRAGRTYLATVRFISGNVRTVLADPRNLAFFVAEYSAASGVSDRVSLGTVTAPTDTDGLNATAIQPFSAVIQPTADTRYGFVMQDPGGIGYTDFTFCVDLQDITDLILTPVTGTKASGNIAAGQYFMVGNGLYYSTAAITSGSDIVPGTNCNSVSVADALNTIISQ